MGAEQNKLFSWIRFFRRQFYFSTNIFLCYESVAGNVLNAKKILSFSIGPIGAALLGVVTLPLLAWFFPVEDVGRFAMLQVAISLSVFLFCMGMDQAYVREYCEVSDKPSLFKTVIHPSFLMMIFLLITISLIPLSLSQILFGYDSVVLSSLLILSVILFYNSRFLGLILRMQERGLAYSIGQITPKVVFLGVIMAVVSLDSGASFEVIMIANTFSIVIFFVVLGWLTRAEWSQSFKSKVDRAKQRKMLRYAIPLVGSGLAFWSLTTLDKIFLRSWSSFEELGVFSIAATLAGVALVLQSIFSTIWPPVIFKWASEGVNLLKFKNLMDYISLVVILIWSLVGGLSWFITFLLPAEYSNVQYIILAVIAYPLLYTMSEVMGVGIAIKRRTIFFLVASLIALLINVVMNWVLIPKYGASGAAIATAISFFVFFSIRTEFSAHVWESFERFRIYGLLFLLILLGVLFNVFQVGSLTISLSYFVVGLLALFIFKQQTISIFKFCASYI